MKTRHLLHILLAASAVSCALLVDPASWELASSQARSRLPAGLLAGAAAALLARASGAATAGGAAAGAILAAVVWSAAGWRAFVLLGTFVALASGVTLWRARRPGHDRRTSRKDEARNARQALANLGAAGFLALLGAMGRIDRPAVLAAFAGSLAAALCDTVATEAGLALRGRSILITTGRPVSPGTDGGISLPGTVAGASAALILGLATWAVGWLPPRAIHVVALAGIAGCTADSFLGATLERRGWLENDSVNYLATTAGALTALALWRALA